MALAPDAPRLADWITLTEAADMLGVTKQAVHKMVSNQDIKSLHCIGERPVYVVSEKEIKELFDKRVADDMRRQQMRAQREEERQAKASAREAREQDKAARTA